MPQDYEPIGFRVSAEDNASSILDNVILRLEKLQALTKNLGSIFGASTFGNANSTAQSLQQVAQSTKLWTKYNELAQKSVSSLTAKEAAFVKSMISVKNAQDGLTKAERNLIKSRNTAGESELIAESAGIQLDLLESQRAEYQKIVQAENNRYIALSRLDSAQQSLKNQETAQTTALNRYNSAVITATQRLNALSTSEETVKNKKNASTTATEQNTNAVKNNTKQNEENSNSLLKTGIRLSTITVLARSLGKAFGEALNESGAYYENLNLFAVTFGETYEETLDWSLKLADNLGFASSEVVRFTGLFKQLGTAIEITSDTSDKMSEVLTSLGYDLASFYNITTESAFEKLQAGIFSGQTKPLRSLGLDVTYQTLDNVLQTNEAFAELGITSSKGLDQATKAMLRLLVVLQNSQNAWGDTTKTIESYENQIRVLNGSISNLKLAIGDAFRDTFAQVLVYINGIIQGITAVIRAFVPMETEIDNVSAAMTQYNEDEYNDTTTQNTALADFDNFRTLSGSEEEQELSIQEAITQELEEQMQAYEDYINSLDEVQTKSKDIADTIKGWFVDDDGDLTGKAKGLIAVLAGFTGLGIANSISKYTNGISKAIELGNKLSLTQNIVNTAFSKTGLIIGGIVAIFAAMYIKNEDFRNSVNRLIDALINLVGSTLDPLTNVLNAVLDIITPIIETLAEILTPIIDITARLFELEDGWVAVASIIAIFVATKAPSLIKTLSSVGQSISTLGKKGLSALGSLRYGAVVASIGLALCISNIVDLAKNWDSMSGLERARGILLAVAGAAMVLASALATVQSTWSFGAAAVAIVASIAAIGVAIKAASDEANTIDQTIQGFANGGITDANLIMTNEHGTREWVGSQGNNAAVVNDTQMSDIMEDSVERGSYKGFVAAMSTMNNRGKSTANQNIVIQIGQQEIFRAVRTEALRLGYDFQRVN